MRPNSYRKIVPGRINKSGMSEIYVRLFQLIVHARPTN